MKNKKRAIAIDRVYDETDKMVQAIKSQHDENNIARVSYGCNNRDPLKKHDIMNLSSGTTLTMVKFYAGKYDVVGAIKLVSDIAPNSSILFFQSTFPIEFEDKFGDIVEFIHSDYILGRQVYW